MESTKQTSFPGFDLSKEAKFFKYPSDMDKYWYLLTGSEQKVLDFILRQTIGFKKSSDTIAYSQIETGIKGFNHGTGLSRSQVHRAVNSLENKGFIRTTRHHRKPHVFQLVTREESVRPTQEATSSPKIARLIRLFEPVAGHLVERYLRSKKEQDAIQNLVESYGEEHLESVINALPLVQSKKFVPVITSPSDLDDKYPRLVSALKRIREEENNGRGFVL